MDPGQRDDLAQVAGSELGAEFMGGVELWQAGAEAIADGMASSPSAAITGGGALAGWFAAGPTIVVGVDSALVLARVAGFVSYAEKWFIDLGISQSCDPNALIGPGQPSDPTKPFDGGTIHPSDRAPYTVEFQNVGSAAARTIEVDVDVPQLDASRFSLDEVHFGSLDVSMYKEHRRPDETQLWNGTATVPINGGTNTLHVAAAFNPNDSEDQVQNLAAHRLRVVFTGPPTSDQFGLIDPSSDILPPDTTPPQGEGFVSFSAPPKAGLTTVHQDPAQIYFDNNPVVPTNAWDNTITNDYPVQGLKFSISRSVVAKGDKFGMKLYDTLLGDVADPTANGMTVDLRIGGVNHVYSLPAQGWIKSGVVYKYRQAVLVNGARVILPGPLTSASFNIVSGSAVIAARGSQLADVLNAVPSSVEVLIRQPGVQQGYCVVFSGTPTQKKLTVTKPPPPRSQCPE
jgi:hypothetical protein